MTPNQSTHFNITLPRGNLFAGISGATVPTVKFNFSFITFKTLLVEVFQYKFLVLMKLLKFALLILIITNDL